MKGLIRLVIPVPYPSVIFFTLFLQMGWKNSVFEGTSLFKGRKYLNP